MSASSAKAATDKELLNACENALYAKDREATLCDLGVRLREDEMARLNAENVRLREQGTSVWSNPFIWAAVGVIVGAYAGARAVR